MKISFLCGILHFIFTKLIREIKYELEGRLGAGVNDGFLKYFYFYFYMQVHRRRTKTV